MNETQIKLREIVELQKKYEELENGKIPFTKNNLCAICVPFKNKYELNDDQVLRIARRKMNLNEMVEIMKL